MNRAQRNSPIDTAFQMSHKVIEDGCGGSRVKLADSDLAGQGGRKFNLRQIADHDSILATDDSLGALANILRAIVGNDNTRIQIVQYRSFRLASITSRLIGLPLIAIDFRKAFMLGARRG